jgi:hypothetical protein
MAVKGDEVLVDEGISGQDIVVQRELEERADFVEAVVRQKRCSIKAKLPPMVRSRSGHRGCFSIMV